MCFLLLSSLTTPKLRKFSLAVETHTFGHSGREISEYLISQGQHITVLPRSKPVKTIAMEVTAHLLSVYLLIVADDLSLHVYSFLVSETIQGN